MTKNRSSERTRRGTIPCPKIEVYQDTAGTWRWRARARNGMIVVDSGEGYVTRQKALAGLDITRCLLKNAPVDELPPPAPKHIEAVLHGLNRARPLGGA